MIFTPSAIGLSFIANLGPVTLNGAARLVATQYEPRRVTRVGSTVANHAATVGIDDSVAVVGAVTYGWSWRLAPN
jgi:hypothetical protein